MFCGVVESGIKVIVDVAAHTVNKDQVASDVTHDFLINRKGQM